MSNISSLRKKGNDSYLVQSFSAFKTGLDLYYSEYGKYPRVPNGEGGTNFRGFFYNDGTCSNPKTTGELRFNSTSASNDRGFLTVLYDNGFINERAWMPLLGEDRAHTSIYNCRYVIPYNESENDNVQKYLLHCNLEKDLGLETKDEGFNDTVYEIQSEPWICMCGENGQGGTPIPGAC